MVFTVSSMHNASHRMIAVTALRSHRSDDMLTRDRYAQQKPFLKLMLLQGFLFYTSSENRRAPGANLT